MKLVAVAGIAIEIESDTCTSSYRFEFGNKLIAAGAGSHGFHVCHTTRTVAPAPAPPTILHLLPGKVAAGGRELRDYVQRGVLKSSFVSEHGR